MSNNIIKDRIEREARELIANLYGTDVAKMRRQLIAFNAKVMNAVDSTDSLIDPVMLRVIRSKYTTAIVMGAFALAFYAGILVAVLTRVI